jgi:hypothetical protein
MKPLRWTSVFWLLLIVIVAGLSAAAQGILVSHAHAYTEPASHLDLSVLLRMPIPVANKIDNGWVVVSVFWVTVILMAWCGSRLATSLSRNGALRIVGFFAVIGVVLAFYLVLFSAVASA